MSSVYKHVCLVCAAFLTFAFGAFAQKATVSGTVRDTSGEPLPGAAVIIQSSTNGVMTDQDGKYSIQAKPEDELVFSFIGYESQTIKVGRQAVIDVVLMEESNFLNETVVVGYGVQKKVNLTGSVASVDYAEVSKSRPFTSSAQGLIGTSAGVQVTQASGKPGPQKFSGKAPALFCHKKSIFAAAYFPFRFFIYTSTASPFFMTLTLPLNLSSRGPGSRGMVTGGKASSKWSSTTFRGFSRRMVLTAGL